MFGMLRWLFSVLANLDELIRLTNPGMVRPYPERFMEAFQVSWKVNSPSNDSPELIDEEVEWPGAKKPG